MLAHFMESKMESWNYGKVILNRGTEQPGDVLEPHSELTSSNIRTRSSCTHSVHLRKHRWCWQTMELFQETGKHHSPSEAAPEALRDSCSGSIHFFCPLLVRRPMEANCPVFAHCPSLAVEQFHISGLKSGFSEPLSAKKSIFPNI